MARQWSKERIVAVPPPEKFHSVEAYRWSRLAPYMDMGMNAPEYMDDDYLDEIINACWENRHWALRHD